VKLKLLYACRVIQFPFIVSVLKRSSVIGEVKIINFEKYVMQKCFVTQKYLADNYLFAKLTV